MNSDQTNLRPNFLRLVDTKPIPDPITHDTFARPAWQTTLFANENPLLLLFINFEEVNEIDFRAVLTGARPKFLFDLRAVPRFDLGGLNRKQAFALFSKAGTKYVDLSAQLNVGGAADFVSEGSVKLILNSSNQTFLQGPVAFLVNTQQFDENYISRLVEMLPSGGSSPWDVLRVPFFDAHQAQKALSRTIVFISHANPEDNAFTTWLAGQLAVAGYSVWSDVTQLVGGEVFWDDVEETIRLRAAKVVAVLSTAAQKKPGVLDEIDLAVRVERSSGLNRFVLPVRLDELSHSDVRANLARRNIIDFRENWASGLHSLLSVLERDGVPRSNGNAEALSRWVMDRFLQQNTIVAKTERLISNWLRIARLPEFIFLHNVSAPVERIDTIIRSLTRASFRYLRLIGSFSTAEDLQQAALPDVVLSETYRIKLDDFIRGKAPELPGLPRWEANKLTIRLLRQAWDLNMEQRGLHSFETASGYLAWYMPKGFLDGDRVEFQDDGGKKRRKSLVGWSERRKVFWHFAVEARPVLGECPHFVLKPHVIFTPNGKSAVESKERMHLLRRQFCRSWWNDRWRDLLIAFVTWLSRTEGCALVVGRTSSIQLDSKLMSIISPVSVAVDQNLPMVVGEQEDELDVGDDIEFFEELAASALEDGERKAGA